MLVMKFVRWKRYGFTHIAKSVSDPREIPGYGKAIDFDTLCGQPAYGGSMMIEQGERFRNYGKGLLPPSEKDDGKRPLCGTCKRIAKL